MKADGSTAPKCVLLKKLVSNNPHPNMSLFDSLISDGAFDLQEGPIFQCVWVQWNIDEGLTELP